jgi:hypothetical protein
VSRVCNSRFFSLALSLQLDSGRRSERVSSFSALGTREICNTFFETELNLQNCHSFDKQPAMNLSCPHFAALCCLRYRPQLVLSPLCRPLLPQIPATAFPVSTLPPSVASDTGHSLSCLHFAPPCCRRYGPQLVLSRRCRSRPPQ